jgi:hypothetical protein
MKTSRFRHWFARCLWAGFTAMALSASAQPDKFEGDNSDAFKLIPADTGDWTRHFRLGAFAGVNISANFSEKGTFNVSGNNTANGIYDDGYVRPDQSGDPNYTGYWGYNNASQYNAANNTLAFHGTSSYSTSGNSKEDGSVFAGMELAYGDNIWYWKHARVGWELGFGLLPINITDKQSMGATVNQTTYTFNTGGITIPGAPYQGGPSGQGEPIISTAYTTTNSSSPGIVTGTQTLDVMLYTVRLGPTFYWDLGDYVGMSLGAGPAVGVVSGDYKYDDVITVDSNSTHNSGQIGATKMVYGGYVNAMFMVHVMETGDIYAGVQYMPLTDATFSGSGREGRLNLGGQLDFSLGVNWPF